MATRIDPPVTLAQFKQALAVAETEKQALSKDLERVQTNGEVLASDLKTTRTALQSAQDELARLEREDAQTKERLVNEALEARNALLAAVQDAEQAQRLLKQAQTELASSRSRAAAIEAQAGRQLADATEVLSRMKLEAVAAADRELKLGREMAALKNDLDRQLKSVTEATESHDDLEAEVKALRQQVDGLVEENRRIAVQRDVTRADQAVLLQHASEQQQREAVVVAAARAAALAEAQVRMVKVQEDLQLAQSRLASLSAQMASSGKLEVLAPEQVGTLMGGFLRKIEGSMPSLRLAEGELKLKLGLARTETAQGFVIIAPGAGEDLQKSLHEISLKFDRSGALERLTDNT